MWRYAHFLWACVVCVCMYACSVCGGTYGCRHIRVEIRCSQSFSTLYIESRSLIWTQSLPILTSGSSQHIPEIPFLDLLSMLRLLTGYHAYPALSGCLESKLEAHTCLANALSAELSSSCLLLFFGELYTSACLFLLPITVFPSSWSNETVLDFGIYIHGD